MPSAETTPALAVRFPHLSRLLMAGVAGFATSLAFEPVAMPYVLPVCLGALALLTRGVRARTGFLVATVFGACFYLVHIWWMEGSIGAAAWIGLSALETFFIGLFGAAAAVLHRTRLWPAWLAVAWTGTEVVRSEWPFSGMPWGRLGYAAIDTPVAPALAYVGINGVTLLIALLGFSLARLALARGPDLRGALAAVVVVAAVAVTPALHPWQLDVTGEVRVAAVQGDVPGRGNDILLDSSGVTQNHVDATVDLAARIDAGEVPPVDFVLWPENSTAVDPVLDAVTRAQVEEAVAAVQVPILVGAVIGDGPDHTLNQGIVWDPVTGPGARYTKWHPVPFGEFIPFRGALEQFGLTDSGQLARIPRDMRSGTGSGPLTVAGVDLADSICFDIAYDDVFTHQIEEGAELVTVQTSNASFVFTDQLEQQFAMTRVRAIETGKATVVASTNGITGAITADGDVVDRTQRRTQDVVVATLETRSGVTPGTRIGATLRLATPVATLLAVLAAAVTYRRAHGAPRGARPRRDGDPDLQRGGEPGVGGTPAAAQRP